MSPHVRGCFGYNSERCVDPYRDIHLRSLAQVAENFSGCPWKSESLTDLAKRRPRTVHYAVRGFSSLCHLCSKLLFCHYHLRHRNSSKILFFCQIFTTCQENFLCYHNCITIPFCFLPCTWWKEVRRMLASVLTFGLGVVSSIIGNIIYEKFFKNSSR